MIMNKEGKPKDMHASAASKKEGRGGEKKR